MRNLSSLALAALVVLGGSAVHAQSSQSGAAPAESVPQDSLAAAARKAKEQKKTAPKAVATFTNDNLPTDATISTVGSTPAASDKGTEAGSATSQSKDEKYWRAKFAKLNAKLQQDQADLSVSQRELGVLNVQNYDDPVKAMQQGYSREDISVKTAEIDAKKKAVADDQQAISDAQDDLRKAGGDSGWAQ
jgi:hypothetical protein